MSLRMQLPGRGVSQQSYSGPLQVLSAKIQALQGSKASAIRQVALEEQLMLFNQSVAACERIAKQPIPLAYTRHATHCLCPMHALGALSHSVHWPGTCQRHICTSHDTAFIWSSIVYGTCAMSCDSL